MENVLKHGLDTPISGKDMMDYMSALCERNDAQQIEIERAKITIGILKQMHNHSRLLLKAKEVEMEMITNGFVNGNK